MFRLWQYKYMLWNNQLCPILLFFGQLFSTVKCRSRCVQTVLFQISKSIFPEMLLGRMNVVKKPKYEDQLLWLTSTRTFTNIFNQQQWSIPGYMYGTEKKIIKRTQNDIISIYFTQNLSSKFTWTRGGSMTLGALWRWSCKDQNLKMLFFNLIFHLHLWSDRFHQTQIQSNTLG